jgi:hypothetical protein
VVVVNHGVKFVDDKAIVVVQCLGGQKGFEVVVPFKGYRAWIEGVIIQKAMPTVGRDERELLISGTCGACWEKLFPPEVPEAEGYSSETAMAQGWFLADSDERGLEIQRDDEARVFVDDEAARGYVEQAAAAGDTNAQAALAAVAAASALEREEEKEPVSLLTSEERESLGLNGATLVASEVIEPPAPKSWAPEVIADASGKWTGNGLRFARKEDAEKWVEGLRMRWYLVMETRVVPSEDAPNQEGELHSPHRVQL